MDTVTIFRNKKPQPSMRVGYKSGHRPSVMVEYAGGETSRGASCLIITNRIGYPRHQFGKTFLGFRLSAIPLRLSLARKVCDWCLSSVLSLLKRGTIGFRLLGRPPLRSLAMYVFNMRLSFKPRRLSVRKILAYGFPGGPTFINTFSGFEISSI